MPTVEGPISASVSVASTLAGASVAGTLYGGPALTSQITGASVSGALSGGPALTPSIAGTYYAVIGELTVSIPMPAVLAGLVYVYGDLVASEAPDTVDISGDLGVFGDAEIAEASDGSDFPGVLISIVQSEAHAYTCYTCRVTGTPDIRVPISSFATRLRSGAQSYLSVVIPAADEYAETIADRLDEDLVVTRTIYAAGGAVISTEDIATANIYDLRLDRGSSSMAATVTGYKQSTPPTQRIVYLDGLSSLAESIDAEGTVTSVTARTRPHNSLLPGDTARLLIGGVVTMALAVDMISYSVSTRGEVFEVTGTPL